MNVFVSYAHSDRDFSLKLAGVLESDGYDVFIDNKIPIGNNIYRDIGKRLAKADVVIIVISQGYYADHGFVANETVSMLSFFDKGRMPLVIPIVLGKYTKVPADLNRFNYLVIPYETDTDNEVEYSKYGPKVKGSDTANDRVRLDKEIEKKTISQIRLIVAAHQEKIDNEAASKKAAEEKVQGKLSEYLQETLTTLKINKIKNQWLAYIFYFLSVIPLGVAIVMTLKFPQLATSLSQEPIPLAITSASQMVMLVLLISISKLFFALGKSFMVESIRNSDRIHAISFGKFFLDAYGDTATREEVLKAFSAWNIDDGKTSFRELSGSDYDPKLDTYLDGIKEIVASGKK